MSTDLQELVAKERAKKVTTVSFALRQDQIESLNLLATELESSLSATLRGILDKFFQETEC